MLGFRGAGRYVSESFRDCFALECEFVRLEVRQTHDHPFRIESGTKGGDPFGQAANVELAA
jgi:phosphoenolpyruvate synthase/pyruvate phosphate dikinase